MRKRYIFGIISLTLALVFVLPGCAGNTSSHTVSESESGSLFEEETEENSEPEIENTVVYKSLIEKYVGETGTSYKAYELMVRHDEYFNEDRNRIMPLMYPTEKWLDSDGKLRLPFEPHDIETSDTFDYQGTRQEINVIDEMIGVVSYYIPDELAVKASTAELVDVVCSYGYDTGWIMSIKTPMNPTLFEYEFNNNLAHCNALEESLRRDDFAVEYLEKYMTESEDMAEYYEGMEDENVSVFLSYMSECRKSNTLDMFEVILAQPEAYGQLTEEQRAALVECVLERAKLGEQGKLCISSNEYNSLFLTCIAGKCYLSGNLAYTPFDKGEVQWRINPYTMGEIQWNENPWIDFIKGMDLSEDERNEVERFFDI